MALEKRASPWQGAMVVFLGIIVLGLGFSAIVAANWEITPDWLKLTGNGLLLAALAWVCFRLYDKGLAFEFALLALLFYVLVSVGLIGQVFHTGSPLYVALALWCVMTAGFPLISRRMPVPAFWLAGAGAALFMYWLDNTGYEERMFSLLPLLALAYALLALLAGFFRGASSPQAKASATLFSIMLVTGALAAEFMHETVLEEIYASGDNRLYALVMLAAALIMVMLARFFNKGQKIALSLGALWCVGYLYHWFRTVSLAIRMFLYDGDYSYLRYEFIDPVCTFALLAWLAFYAVASGYRRLFLLWLILAGARISAIFFMASYELWQTGLAFIASGAILVFIPILWKKTLRDKLFARPEMSPAAGAQAEAPQNARQGEEAGHGK